MREPSGSRGYQRSRVYQGPSKAKIDINRNQNGFEFRGEPRGKGRGAFRGRYWNYQGRGQGYQDRDQPYQERYREAQRYNPYTKQCFSKIKNLINQNRTHKYDNRNRGESWDD
ncbi:MAG: hypothetical protein EZS28_022977, partial [Streblomastix strix]